MLIVLVVLVICVAWRLSAGTSPPENEHERLRKLVDRLRNQPVEDFDKLKIDLKMCRRLK
jgi:hypothetical protein